MTAFKADISGRRLITNKIDHSKLCRSKGKEHSKVSYFSFLRLAVDRRDLSTYRNTKNFLTKLVR
jgi:hypothetical protein